MDRTYEINSVITEDSPFGDLYMDINDSELWERGYELADSVDVEFGCGFKFSDIPLLNGYYAGYGNPVVCAYPSRGRIAVALCGGVPTSGVTGSYVGDTVKITLNTKGKYLTLQQSLGVAYTCDREDYESDIVFSNFRVMEGGSLKKDTFYRSASPCDNQYGRAVCTDSVISKAGIASVLNLADSAAQSEEYINSTEYEVPYYFALYNEGRALPVALTVNYRAEKYARTVAEGLMNLSKLQAPYLIHCTEGKDRTGFVCILMEALCGATVEEMERDYMISYDNYYGIKEETDKEKYDAIVKTNFHDMLAYLSGEKDKERMLGADYKQAARRYLSFGGLDDAGIDSLISWMNE